MPWPFTFGTATSPLAAQHWDDMFNQVGAGMSLPCSAAGSNAISLTPLAGFPALAAYSELGGYRFRAAATSTGAVTAQYNGLGFLPVYHADGTTQANVNDFLIGQQYIITFSQSLNGGLGGFFFESPSQPLVSSTWAPPGGRLTLQSSTPVMTTSSGNAQTVFYAPYISPFVPIYNGSNVQMYQFTSSLSDTVGLQLNMAGNAAWPSAAAFDVFATIIGGVPVLCTIPWTNSTTRATTVVAFAGFLTNGGAATSLRNGPTTFTLPVNQGTFLGSFINGGSNGATNFVFGGAASGGSQTVFNLCNYYNKVLFTSIVQDSGAAYTYTSATVRVARASITNSHNLFMSDSERSIILAYNSQGLTTAVAGALEKTGIGLTTSAFNALSLWQNPAAAATNISLNTPYNFSATGSVTVSALEAGDGANANTFNQQSLNSFALAAWF